MGFRAGGRFAAGRGTAGAAEFGVALRARRGAAAVTTPEPYRNRFRGKMGRARVPAVTWRCRDMALPTPVPW